MVIALYIVAAVGSVAGILGVRYGDRGYLITALLPLIAVVCMLTSIGLFIAVMSM